MTPTSQPFFNFSNPITLETIFGGITAFCAFILLIYFFIDRQPRFRVIINQKDKILLEPNKLNLDFSIVKGPLIEVVFINCGKVTLYPEIVQLHLLESTHKLYMVEKDTEIYSICSPIQDREIVRSKVPNLPITSGSSRIYYLTFESIREQCSLESGKYSFQAFIYLQTNKGIKTKKITCEI